MSDRPDSASAPPKDPRSRNPEDWVHLPIRKYRNPKYQRDYRPGDAFFELADAVVKPEHTLLGYDRLYGLWQSARNVATVPGAVAEIGTFRGGSAFFLASAFQVLAPEPVPIHVFDTFEGHPEEAVSAEDPFQKPGQFAKTSMEKVRELLAPFPAIHLYKGEVAASLPQLAESAYRLVHIDVDLHRPMLTCLEYFGARMSPGGVIVVDDYASPKCPGVPKAAADYLSGTDAFQVWDVRTEQLMLIKR